MMEDQSEIDLGKVFNYNEYLKLHHHVALIQSSTLGKKDQIFKIYGYNFYLDQSTYNQPEIILNNFWSNSLALNHGVGQPIAAIIDICIYSYIPLNFTAI